MIPCNQSILVLLEERERQKSSVGKSRQEHPEETSKNSDICDFLKVSDIKNEW